MNEASKLQGTIADQLSLEYLSDHADVFSIPELGVVLTREGMSLPAGQHAHDSYEFLLPIDRPFSAVIEKKSYIIKNEAIFPINSQQYHGPEISIDNFHCLILDINKDYLCDLSTTLFGLQDLFFENTNFPVKDNTRLLIKLYIDEYKTKQTGYFFIMQNLANYIMVDLIRNYKNYPASSGIDKKYIDKQHIRLVTDFLHENYKNDYSLENIAKIANYSPYYLIRIFKDTTGQTPYEYLMDIKIKAAKDFLKNTTKPIIEICYACGFNSPNHFTLVFKRRTGITPSKYRSTSDF